MNFVDIVFINLLFECPLAFLKPLSFYFLKPGFPLHGTCFRIPCDPESKMAVLYAGSPQVEKHISLCTGWTVPDRARTLRMEGEDVDHTCVLGYAVEVLPHPVEFIWNASCIGKFRTEHLPLQKMSSIFALKFGILCVIPKLGQCVKIQWNF